MKRIAIISCILFSLVTFCKAPETDYQGAYRTVLLLQLSNSQANPNQSCSSAVSRQVQCLRNFCTRSTGFEDLCLQQVLSGIGLSPDLATGGSSVSTCNTILASSTFQKMSERGQACILQCQETDWNTKISSGECRDSTSIETIFRNTSNVTVTACIRSCFQATNTRPTDSEIQNSLILSIIQQGAK